MDFRRQVSIMTGMETPCS